MSTTAPSPELTNDETRALERAFAARDSWAFEAAYRLHARSLMGAACSVLRDVHAAQDCVHDVLAKLWQRGNAYQLERGSLSAFLITCVRNEALSRSRKDRNRERIERMIPVEVSYDERWSDPVEEAQIRRALERLNEEQRDAITLAYYEHMTYKEIAREKSVPLGTVKSRMYAALSTLRTLLVPVAAAFILGLLPATYYFSRERAATTNLAKDSTALHSLVHSHFLHAAFTPLIPGAPAAKTIYARDGSWLYIIVDGIHAYNVVGQPGNIPLGTLDQTGSTSTLYLTRPARVRNIELRDNQTFVTQARIMYPLR